MHPVFKKFDADKRIAYGEVYAPNRPDSQGDFMVAEDIEKMAHRFLSSGKVNQIDTEHDLKNNGSLVVESFVARKGDPDFAEGAWVMGVYIPDDDQWAAVKKGGIGGFSMYGMAKSIPCELTIEIPDDGVVKGETMDYEGHVHRYTIKFDENGNFLGGETDEVDGHSHKITKGTVTEGAGSEEHSHRFSFWGNIA